MADAKNINDSMAFKKYTNNRYKFEQVDGETIYRMTPGLNADEMLGMIVPIIPDLNGYTMVFLVTPLVEQLYPEGVAHRDDIYELMYSNPDPDGTPITALLYCGETGKVIRITGDVPTAEDFEAITAKG